MDNTLQRLKKFIEFKKLSISSFEKSVGFSNGSFASQLKNNKTIGVDKLEKILNVYPELSSEWVLTGKGDMIDIFYQPQYYDMPPSKAEKKGLTARQRFIIDDSESKILNYIKNEVAEYGSLYNSINEIERFRDFSSLFSKAYIDKLLDAIYSADTHLIDNKINFADYKEQVTKQFDNLAILNEPLKKLVDAILIFYTEFKPLDNEKLLTEIDY